MARGALPTFLIIGAAKTGTTALHEYLALHPGISMSDPKELNFFVEHWNWEKGLDWYRGHFDPARPVRGESSPHYTAHPLRQGVPERIVRTIPEVRLIYIVRDPIARIASSYTNLRAARREWRSPEGALGPDSRHVVRSRYMHQLDQYLEHVPKERILVLDNRELLERRSATLERVFAFVGADPTFRHPDHERTVNTTSDKRPATALGASVRKRINGTPIDTRLVRGAIRRVEGLVPRPPVERVDVRDALAPEVVEQLREDAVRLRSFTGLALDHWSV